jgi:hypothetical protein
MIKSADVVFPRVKYRKNVKPFWNSTLKDLRKAFMAARLEWIRKGSPRFPENIYYMQYKKAKCKYRREQKRSAWEFERKELDELAYSNEINPRQCQQFAGLVFYKNPIKCSGIWINY